MAVEEESFEGIPPDENREIWDDAEHKFWSKFQVDCKEWRDTREAKYSHETTNLRVQLSELSGKRNAIYETYTRLRAQLVQTEDELSDVSQRLTAKESEFSSLNEDHRMDVETKHKEWEHQMRVMTNFFREKRGDPPLPEDAIIEPLEVMAPLKLVPEHRSSPLPVVQFPSRRKSFEAPPPPSTVPTTATGAAAAAAPIPKSAPPGQQPSQEEHLAREALAQSSRVPTPAEPSPPKVPTNPITNGHWDIVRREGRPPSPPRGQPLQQSQPQYQQQQQQQQQRQPNGSPGMVGMEDAYGRTVRDHEMRLREEREKRDWEQRDQEFRDRDIQERVHERERREREAVREREIARERESREWEHWERDRRAREIRERTHLERDVREQILPPPRPLPSSHAPPFQTEPHPPPPGLGDHQWANIVQADRDRLNRYAYRNGDRPVVGPPGESSQPLTRTSHTPQPPASLQSTPQHRSISASQTPRGPTPQGPSPALPSTHILPSLSQQRLPPPSTLDSRPPHAHLQPQLHAHGMAHPHHLAHPHSILPQHPEPQRQQHAPLQHRQPPLPAAQALPSMRHSLPATGGFRPANSGFTPANQPVISRPQSPLAVTPAASARNSPTAPERSSEPLVEINRDNLVLQHDGTVYTWPECMAGVPRRKIHPGDPYWEPDWKDVRSEVVEAKERWHQKHQRAIELEAKKEKSGSSKYQIGRQVNRGTKILEFLDDEDQISPYQLLAKPFMHASKGGITSYDTLFRLCETLSELAKFNLDISPVDWMRHRLYEIMLETPDGAFNLPKIVHDFYHDPKLTDLRHKHGYKNIGRPSGQTKGGRQSAGPGPSEGTPKQPRKRKSAASALGTPHDEGEPMPSHSMVIHDEGPFLQARSAIAKKPRTEDWERHETSEPEASLQSEVQQAPRPPTTNASPKNEHTMNGAHEPSRDTALKV